MNNLITILLVIFSIVLIIVLMIFVLKDKDSDIIGRSKFKNDEKYATEIRFPYQQNKKLHFKPDYLMHIQANNGEEKTYKLKLNDNEGQCIISGPRLSDARKYSVDIILPDRLCSSSNYGHAGVYRDSKGYYISDHNSTNHVYLINQNGTKTQIQQMDIFDGMVVKLGRTTITFKKCNEHFDGETEQSSSCTLVEKFDQFKR